MLLSLIAVAAQASRPVATFDARGFSLNVFADCTAQLASARDKGHAAVPFAELYNEPSDNRALNMEACANATLASPGTLRLGAANGYGFVDVAVFAAAANPWLSFRVASTAAWRVSAKHIRFGALWSGVINETAAATPLVMGRLQGPRGLLPNGHVGPSAGYVTVSRRSCYRYIFNAQPGDELGFVFGPTETIDAAWQAYGKSRGVLAQSDTLVVLMGTRKLRVICEGLLAGGAPVARPVAIVHACYRPEQRLLKGTLGDIADQAEGQALSPAIIVIGNVAAFAQDE